MTESAWLVTPATILFDDSRTPRADAFDDVYFSADDGLAESRHVFLQCNQLPERFAALDSGQQGEFIIAETGFGTGLNFLATTQLWLRTAPVGWQLTFISAEKFPLRCDDLATALAHWPELQALAEELLAQYPPLLRGHHRLSLMQGRVQLQLIFDDAHDAFQQLLETDYPAWQQISSRCIDAFFLDGFAPAKNPDLWSDVLFQTMARLSKPGTTLATFTSAGDVKRGLQRAGFAVQKVAGFGRKRDMLCGSWQRQTSAQAFVPSPRTRQKFTPLWALDALPRHSHRQRSALVVGAGLAGAHTAYALATRGWQVQVIDAASDIASGASGNAQGVLYTKLSAKPDNVSRFALSSYLHALRAYRRLQGEKILSPQAVQFCGVLQLDYDDAARALSAAVATAFALAPDIVQRVDANEATRIAGIALTQSALWMANAGFALPPQICRDLLSQPSIHLQLNTCLAQLRHDKGQWFAFAANGREIMGADIVVLCNGNDACRLPQTSHLPLKPVRGQVTSIETNPLLSALHCVICHDGYLPPVHAGQHCLGATFSAGRTDTMTVASDHADNLERLVRNLPALSPDMTAINATILQGRAALRCTTPDYLPVVGPIADVTAMRRQFAGLADNAQALIAAPGAWLPALYINSGHGSRGLSSTPLCAELIASYASGTSFPLASALRLDLHPARFLIRDLKRARDVAYT